MVYYTVWDMIPFLLLGVLMVIWFGMAVTVTFTSSGMDDATNLDTAEDSFEYMFYAMLGNFEDKVRLLSSPMGNTVYQSLYRSIG